MRISVLWKGLSGYMAACLRELGSRPSVDLQLFHTPPSREAPFEQSWMDTATRRTVIAMDADRGAVLGPLQIFRPDLVLVCSWNVAAYRGVARSLRNVVPRVLCMDNQWLATPKQLFGVGLSPFVVRPLFDAVFLPGDGQARFARRLGFPQRRIWYGLYACDVSAFALSAGDPAHRDRTFSFVGRMVREKGVDVLLDAYRRYRRMESNEPFTLDLYGTGPLVPGPDNVPAGVQAHGFVQPEALPEHLSRAGALVVPSRFEPWGVVIHEATTAGLPVIATNVCGAAVHLVEDCYNGYLVDPGEPVGLAEAMLRLANLSDEDRRAFSRSSVRLAAQYSPERWADTVQDIARTLG